MGVNLICLITIALTTSLINYKTITIKSKIEFKFINFIIITVIKFKTSERSPNSEYDVRSAITIIDKIDYNLPNQIIIITISFLLI